MLVYRSDPLSDARWSYLVNNHPLGTAFHSVAWLRALKATYGYEPVVLTTSPPGRSLANGLVFCRISSWLTGSRCVSVPFSDYCDVLASSPDEAYYLLSKLADSTEYEHTRYAEIRLSHSLDVGKTGFHETQEFCLHRLELNISNEELFRGFHKDSTQRKIHRAERERVVLEEGRSEAILDAFYHLLVMTRRRYQVPPPPRSWFSNLAESAGEQFLVRVASKGGTPIAAIVTLTSKDTLLYKYGGSDPKYHRLGGMQALFWKAIRQAKDDGLRYLDLGRSDYDNQGLITFKDRLGAVRSKLTYYRYPADAVGPSQGRAARRVFAWMPSRILIIAGRFLYRHVG